MSGRWNFLFLSFRFKCFINVGVNEQQKFKCDHKTFTSEHYMKKQESSFAWLRWFRSSLIVYTATVLRNVKRQGKEQKKCHAIVQQSSEKNVPIKSLFMSWQHCFQ